MNKYGMFLFTLNGEIFVALPHKKFKELIK